jgi:hypothetical protein
LLRSLNTRHTEAFCRTYRHLDRGTVVDQALSDCARVSSLAPSAWTSALPRWHSAGSAKNIQVPKGVDLDRMRIEIEGDFTKHLVTKWLLPLTALLYHQTWTIFENDTGYEFLIHRVSACLVLLT